MPRLNYGTLLENLVVLEAARLCLKHTEAPDGLAFASSFAMPPLTENWGEEKDAINFPAFSEIALSTLSKSKWPTGSLQAFLATCRDESSQIPICYYSNPGNSDVCHKTGGPNGALLVAMLATELGRNCQLWLNDDGGRYGELAPAIPSSKSESPNTNSYAAALVGKSKTCENSHVMCQFPDSIKQLQSWLASQDVAACPVRVGFLDPDVYGDAGASVTRQGHQEWLRTLGSNCDRVLGIMFFFTRGPGKANSKLNQLMTDFHRDELGLFTRSLVFRPSNWPVKGNYLVGVKIRWPDGSVEQIITDLINAIERVYINWGGLPQPLRVYRDGESA